MTRGNQRDMARAKNAAKHAADNKGQRTDGLNRTQAKENDADKMRKKQEAAEERKKAKEAEQVKNTSKVQRQKF